MIQSKRKKVLACLIGMSLAGSLTAMAAPELTAPLLVDGDKTVEDGTRVTVSNVYDALGIAGTSESTGTFTIGGGTGTLHINVTSASAGNSNASGMLIGDDSHVTVNGNLDIKVYGQSCFANGIAMIREGTGQGKKATIAINGNLTIGDPSLKLTDSSDDRNWGVNAEEIHGGYGPDGHVSGQADNYTGARWQPVGVDIDMSGGSVIDLNGDVKLAIRGTALRTDPYYKAGTQHSYDLATINANRGNVTILTPTSTKESFYAAASYGGTININMNGNEAAGHVVNIKGNVLAMRDDNGSGQPYFYQDGRINLGLNTADSQWTGVVDNSGNKQAGEVNLWLQNGARWIHDAPSLPNGMQVNNMPYPSNGQYGKYKNVSYINKLTGGSGEGTAGIIHQNYTSDISIADYSGNTKVFYQHTLGSNSTRENAALYDNKEVNITGGKVTIGEAAAGSTITLITDSKGISDYQKGTHQYKNLVNDALGKLANKLYYSAYATAPTHLTAKVEVAEGLTASSQSLALGNVLFSTGSTGTHQAGQGYYNYTVTSTDDPGNFAFTQLITGDKGRDKTYVDAGILVDEGENYNFTQNTTITAVPAIDVWDGKRTVDGADQQGVDHEVNVNAKGQTLTVVSKEAMKRGVVSGINASSRKGVTVNADKLVIDVENMKGRAEGITVGGQGGKNKDDPYKLTINGDINMKVRGNDYALGLYAAGNSDVTFIGNVTALGDETGEWGLTSTYGAFGYYGVSLVYSGNNYTIQTGPKVTINGDVNAKIDGNGLFANGGHAKLTINGGGNIEINKNNAHNYYAMIAECGTTSMNVNLDGSYQAVDARNNDLILKGNIAASTGAINIKEPEQYTYVNLGLATNKSEWIGVAHNKFNDEGNTTEGKTFYGAINLWLQNGATWKHEKWGPTDDAAWGGKGFTESHLAKLTGGASADKAGVIYQDSDKQIRVDSYSGHTVVFYEHDEANPQTIDGGDFKIANAAEGSSITLVTDSKGITAGFADSDSATDKNNASEVLDKLANKLWYTSYTNGHLKGTVKIAEGLTASSAAKKIGGISFSTDSTGTKKAGQGYYNYTPAVDLKTGPISSPENIHVTRAVGADGSVTVTVEDATVTEGSKYVAALFAGSSSYNKTNPMAVDMNGHDLNLIAQSSNNIAAAAYVTDNTWIRINGSDGKKLSLTANNADTRAANGIFVKGTYANLSVSGPVEIKDIVTKGDSASGISIQGKSSTVSIDGDVTLDTVYGVRGRGLGMNAAGITVVGENSKVNVTGNVTISGVQGSSLKTVGADSEISVGGGTITAAADADKGHNYYAARVEKGAVNINMNNDQAGTNTTKIIGDMYVTGQYGKKVVEYSGGELIDWSAAGKLNVALTNGDSSWTGVSAYDQYKDDYGSGGSTVHDVGEFNLYLQNGASWNNEQQSHASTTAVSKAVYAGSQLATLRGGRDAAHAGVIFQNDANPISVNTYSGNTTVFYKHDETNPQTIKGGDFKITNAAEGSAITLVTDSKGITAGFAESDKAADRNNVSEVLNKLANKLWYTSYTDGHLKGTVKIAEG
ncbi:MAG: hypothetical protein SPI25_06560, partial [Dialister sp.]|nr:hypothetical protein [Dialister sp.]